LREDDRSHGPTLHAPLRSRKREIDVPEGITFAYSPGDGVLPVMMRRVLRARILVAAAGLVLVVCLRPAPSETAPPRAERPIYRIGETWALDRGVYELKRIDGDTYVFVAGPGKEIHLTKDLGVARVVLDGHADFDVAAPPKLSWPLTIGKWGSARALLRSSPPRPLHDFTGTINVLWRVEAYEDVATTAGTLQAFRITYKLETVGTVMGSGQQFGQFSLWYAPGIERLVRAQGDVAAVNWALAKADRPAPPPSAAVSRRSMSPSERGLAPAFARSAAGTAVSADARGEGQGNPGLSTTSLGEVGSGPPRDVAASGTGASSGDGMRYERTTSPDSSTSRPTSRPSTAVDHRERRRGP
jgi:hypothetical protein